MELVVSASLILAYMIAICIKNKCIPGSLFQQGYEQQGLCLAVWTIIMTIESIIIGGFLITHVVEASVPFAIVATLALFIAAIAPLESKKDQSTKHHFNMISSIAGISSQITVLINDSVLLLWWIPWISTYAIFNLLGREWESKIYFVEATCIFIVLTLCFTMLH